MGSKNCNPCFAESGMDVIMCMWGAASSVAQMVEHWTGDPRIASSRLTGCSHYVVSFSKTLYLLLSTGSMCSILWSGVLEQSFGAEYWSGVESDFGVECSYVCVCVCVCVCVRPTFM